MPNTTQSTATTVARWRAAAETADANAAVACLSPDIVLSSPLTEQFRLEGPEEVGDFLASAFTAIEDIRFHTEIGQVDTYALAYRARVGTQPFEEVQLLRVDDDAQISEISLYGRPMPALTALMITLGPKLARQQGRRGLAALLRATSAPVHSMVTFGDRRVVPLTRPRSPERHRVAEEGASQAGLRPAGSTNPPVTKPALSPDRDG